MRADPRGLTAMLAGVALFAAMDATIKGLMHRHNVVEVTAARYGFGLLAALAVAAVIGRRRDWRRALSPRRLGPHALRGVLVVAMSLLFFIGVGRLPLALALTVSFIAPLLIPPIALVILREPLVPRALAAGAVGFAGVVLAAVGGEAGGVDLVGVAATLAGAALYAVTAVLLRARALADGVMVTTILGAAVPAALLLPFALPALATAPLRDLATMAATGLLGTAAFLALAHASRTVEAQRLAPLEFTALGWAALFGWAFFAEPVSVATLAGAAVIAAACLWSAREPAVVGLPPVPRASERRGG